jgi:hypothetical protein
VAAVFGRDVFKVPDVLLTSRAAADVPKTIPLGSSTSGVETDNGSKTRIWMIAKPLKNNHAGVSEG